MLKKVLLSALAAVCVLTAWCAVPNSANAQVFINTPTIKTKLEPTFWDPNPQGDMGMDVFPQVWVGGGGGRSGNGRGGNGPVGTGPVGPSGFNPGGYGQGRPGAGTSTPFSRPFMSRAFSGRR